VAEQTTSYVNLEVNQPVTGVVKYIAHYDERENPKKPGTTIKAKWVLTGTWKWVNAESGVDMQVDAKLSIDDYQLAASPIALGLAKQDGQWDDGNPKYKWTHGGPIRLVKTKQDKRHHVTIQRLDGNGQPIASTPAAGAVPPPPAVSSGRATAEVTRSNSAATPVAVPPSDDAWDALARQYRRSLDIAASAWNTDAPPVEAVHTLFIEANKRGLTVPAPHAPLTPGQKAKNIRDAIDQYAEKPAAIEQDDDLPF
jgi:hypothetical protein